MQRMRAAFPHVCCIVASHRRHLRYHAEVILGFGFNLRGYMLLASAACCLQLRLTCFGSLVAELPVLEAVAVECLLKIVQTCGEECVGDAMLF